MLLQPVVSRSRRRSAPAVSLRIAETAQVQQQLKGLISDTTRLGLFSQVDDVEWEKEEIQKETEAQDEYLMLMDPLNPDGGTGSDDKKKKDGSESKEKKPCDVCGGDGRRPSDITGDQIICKRCGGSGEV